MVAKIWQFNGFQKRRPSSILDFLKLKFLTVLAVKKSILHHHTKFRKDLSYRCKDIAFCDFKDGSRRHVGFSKIRNFNGRSALSGQWAWSSQISSKWAKRLHRYGDLTDFFQNSGRPPSWICWARIGTTHNDHSVVSIVALNLVKIDVVVSIIWNFQYFARLAWKCLFMHAPKIEGLGDFTHKIGSNINNTPKCTSLCESASFEPPSVKIRRRVWLVDEFPKKV